MRLSFALTALVAALAALSSAQKVIRVGPGGEFKTLAGALSNLGGGGGAVEIQLAAGTYNEAVEIRYSGPLTLSAPGGRATIRSSSHKDFGNSAQHNRDASTVIVTGTELTIENIDLINQPSGKGPAQAIYIDRGSSVTMKGVTLQSYQDSVYVQGGARAYCQGCTIVGAVDFLYGEGTMYIEGSTIRSVGPGAITAWRGGSGFRGSKPGCYIANSQVEGGSGGSVYLGRPWDSGAVAVYINTEMGSGVNPAGWRTWQDGDPRVSSATNFLEIGSKGPGFNAASRKIGKVLPESQAGSYSFEAVWGN